MISSALAAACGFSIFAISGISRPRERRCSRTGSRSSRRRTNESAKKSTPMSRPASISARSSSQTAGSETVTFGRLMPCREATLPPTSTLRDHVAVVTALDPQAHRAVGQVEHVARRRTSSAKPCQATGSRVGRALDLLAGEHDARVRAPSSATPPATGPSRSFGPGRSPRIATSRPTRSAAARIARRSRRAAPGCRARS